MSHKVTITFDPTAPRGMRWKAEIRDSNGYYVTSEPSCFSRRSAERKAERYLRRIPGKRAYDYVPKGGEQS